LGLHTPKIISNHLSELIYIVSLKFMISQNRRLELWNFLTAEKNQPRPKGITTQRLVVIRPAILDLDDVWMKVIGQYGTVDCSAADFYGLKAPESIISRTEFWAVE
jgi:hypothetical protein